MTKEEVFEKFNDTISRIPNINWVNYDTQMAKLDTYCWRYIHSDNTSSKNLAYMCRSKGETGVYELFINKLIPFDIKNATVLHEVGHAVLGHTLSWKAQQAIGIDKVKSHWSTLKVYFTKKGKPIKSPTEEICKKIYNMILNVAMDFEVNSKMFEPQEYKWARLFFNFAYISVILQNDEKIKNEELEEVFNFLQALDTFNGNIDFSAETFPKWIMPFCWTEDYGFPDRLSYGQYIDLILMNPDKFFPDFKDKTGKKRFDFTDDTDTESISEEDIDDFITQYGDFDEEEMEVLIEDKRKGKYSSHTDGDKEYVESSDFSKLDQTELENFLYKNCFNKSVKDTRTDYMYNYNRGKFGGDILISKQNKEELWRPGNIFLLVDCSGSIEDSVIDIVVKSVPNVSRKCGPKSRVIWWDTACRGDYPMSNSKVPNNYGGGTEIAIGIDFIKKNYLQFTNDKLIILSDYYDNISSWLDEVSDIKCDVIGICWAQNESGKGKDFLYHRGWYTDSNSTIDTFLDKVKTKFISID